MISVGSKLNELKDNKETCLYQQLWYLFLSLHYVHLNHEFKFETYQMCHILWIEML